MKQDDFIDKIYNLDSIDGMKYIPDGVVDLVIADPPYGLGKDYGNDSDKKGIIGVSSMDSKVVRYNYIKIKKQWKFIHLYYLAI